MEEARDALEVLDRVAVTSPTGSGKSVMAMSIAVGYKPLVLVHTRNLRDQWEEWGMPVMTVQAVLTGNYDLSEVNLLIVDEAHHYAHNTFESVITEFRGKVLAMSATFIRSKAYHGFAHIYDKLIRGPSREELIEEGYGVPAVVRLPGIEEPWTGEELAWAGVESTGMDIIGSIEWAMEWLPNRKTIVFVRSIAQAHVVDRQLRQRGIDSGMAVGPDSWAVEEFEGKGPGTALVTVQLISEGMDLPSCDAVFLLRTIRTPVAAAQAVGRAMRSYPGKSEALVLDWGGTTLIHGHPTLDAPSTLEPEDITRVPLCEECGEPMFRIEDNRCPECGALLSVGGGNVRIMCPLCGGKLDKSGRCRRCVTLSNYFLVLGDAEEIGIGGLLLKRVRPGIYEGHRGQRPVRVDLGNLEATIGAATTKAKSPRRLASWLIRRI